MAIDYEVNSNTITGGVVAYWEPIQTGTNGDGSPQYNTIIYRHRWAIPSLSVTDYLILTTLRGTALTQLKTTDKDTPNSQGTYSTANLMTVTGQQRGRQMLNVQVEFLVDIS